MRRLVLIVMAACSLLSTDCLAQGGSSGAVAAASYGSSGSAAAAVSSFFRPGILSRLFSGARRGRSGYASSAYGSSSEHWTYPGSIDSHLASGHGVNTAGMSQEEMLDLHDALHEGRATGRSYARSYARSSGCPSGNCPQAVSAVQYSYGSNCPTCPQAAPVVRSSYGSSGSYSVPYAPPPPPPMAPMVYQSGTPYNDSYMQACPNGQCPVVPPATAYNQPTPPVKLANASAPVCDCNCSDCVCKRSSEAVAVPKLRKTVPISTVKADLPDELKLDVPAELMLDAPAPLPVLASVGLTW